MPSSNLGPLESLNVVGQGVPSVEAFISREISDCEEGENLLCFLLFLFLFLFLSFYFFRRSRLRSDERRRSHQLEHPVGQDCPINVLGTFVKAYSNGDHDIDTRGIVKLILLLSFAFLDDRLFTSFFILSKLEF